MYVLFNNIILLIFFMLLIQYEIPWIMYYITHKHILNYTRN